VVPRFRLRASPLAIPGRGHARPLAGTAPCASKEPWFRVPDVESQSITDAVGSRVSRCGGAALSMNAPLGSRRDAPIDQAAGQARPLPGSLSGSA